MTTNDKLAEALRLAREWFNHMEAGEGPQARDVIASADEALAALEAEAKPAMPPIATEYDDLCKALQAEANKAGDDNHADLMRKAAEMLDVARAVGVSQEQRIMQLEAKPAPAVEPTVYRYRNINGDGDPLNDWAPVEPRNPHVDTVQDRVRELLAYRYEGKPCYEVQALYAAPAAPAPHPLQALTESCEDEQNAIDAARYRWLRNENNDSAAAVVRDYGVDDPAELDAFIDTAIAAKKGGAA